MYGATTPDWTVKNVEGLVGDDQLTGAPGTIIAPEPTNASDTPYTVTVGVGTLTAGDNYTIVVNKAKLTIAKSEVEPADDVVLPGGNTPENIEEYMEGVPAGTLVAFCTEVWTNDVPEVTTVGTNIVVCFKGHTDADTAAAEFEWSTTGAEGPWSIIEPNFTAICASQVWCRVVNVPNYVTTNVFSYVYIKSRESKPDDSKAEEKDKLQPNPATEKQTEKVVEAIAANDNRYEDPEKPFDENEPVWDSAGKWQDGAHGVQTDAEVNLKVTSIVNLKPEEQKKAEDHLAEEIEDAQKRSDVDPDSVKGRNIDVKLLYTRTYSDGTKSAPVNIGGSNTKIIPFTIAVELGDDEEVLCIVRYHGEKRTEFHAGTDKTTEHFELSANRKLLTVYAKTYSEFILITGVRADEGCPFGYQIKVALKTTSAQSIKDVLPEGKACESGCLRSPATRRLAGFIYGNTEATEGSGPCGEKETGCGCNAWDNAKLLLWDYDTKADARPATASILQLDRIFSRVGDSSMIEIAFRMDGMKYAGFGYAAKRNGQWTVKNLAGFCAGVLPQRCTGKCNDEEPIHVWSVCASENAAPGVESTSTAAYGKWTIDWSPTVYYRVENDQSLIPGPAWDDIGPISFSVE